MRFECNRLAFSVDVMSFPWCQVTMSLDSCMCFPSSLGVLCRSESLFTWPEERRGRCRGDTVNEEKRERQRHTRKTYSLLGDIDWSVVATLRKSGEGEEGE